MKNTFIAFALLIFLVACEGSEGPAGPAGPNGTNGSNSLVALADEPAGDNCTTGGVKITTGVDTNNNATLDGSEVTATQYVCSSSGSGSGPKELKFPLGVFGAGAEVVVNLLYEGFDMKNFEAYDSIVLLIQNTRVVPEGGGDPVDGENVIFEIVDMSEEVAVAIADTEFTAQTGPEFISPNFAGLLPDGKFNLGFSVVMEDDAFQATYKPILVLIDRD